MIIIFCFSCRTDEEKFNDDFTISVGENYLNSNETLTVVLTDLNGNLVDSISLANNNLGTLAIPESMEAVNLSAIAKSEHRISIETWANVRSRQFFLNSLFHQDAEGGNVTIITPNGFQPIDGVTTRMTLSTTVNIIYGSNTASNREIAIGESQSGVFCSTRRDIDGEIPKFKFFEENVPGDVISLKEGDLFEFQSINLSNPNLDFRNDEPTVIGYQKGFNEDAYQLDGFVGLRFDPAPENNDRPDNVYYPENTFNNLFIQLNYEVGGKNISKSYYNQTPQPYSDADFDGSLLNNSLENHRISAEGDFTSIYMLWQGEQDSNGREVIWQITRPSNQLEFSAPEIVYGIATKNEVNRLFINAEYTILDRHVGILSYDELISSIADPESNYNERSEEVISVILSEP